MLVRRLGCLVPLVLLVAAPASAGGGPQAVVGVGAGHHARQIRLGGAVATLLYEGKPIMTPQRAGYVHLYPIFGGLPGAPGRFFPARGVLCFDPPHPQCTALSQRIRQVLGPLARLPLRTQPLTLVHAIYHHRTQLRLGNFAVAIEMAFERGGRRAALPPQTTALRLVWTGPASATRPRRVRIGRLRGLYSRGRVYPLNAGTVAYLRANLGT